MELAGNESNSSLPIKSISYKNFYLFEGMGIISQYLRALSEAHRAAAEIDRLVGTPYAPASGAMTIREQQ